MFPSKCLRHFTDYLRRTQGDLHYLIQPGLFEVTTAKLGENLHISLQFLMNNEARSEKDQLHILSCMVLKMET